MVTSPSAKQEINESPTEIDDVVPGRSARKWVRAAEIGERAVLDRLRSAGEEIGRQPQLVDVASAVRERWGVPFVGPARVDHPEAPACVLLGCDDLEEGGRIPNEPPRSSLVTTSVPQMLSIELDQLRSAKHRARPGRHHGRGLGRLAPVDPCGRLARGCADACDTCREEHAGGRCKQSQRRTHRAESTRALVKWCTGPSRPPDRVRYRRRARSTDEILLVGAG